MHFNPDNKILQFISTTADFIGLNLSFLLTCIPIITIGCAITSLYTITLREARNEGDYPIKSYFREFKRNFKSSTPAWLIILIVEALLLFGMNFWYSMSSISTGIITVFMGVVFIALFLTATYLFPLMARFSNTTLHSVSNAFHIMTNNIIYTLIFAVIDVAVIAGLCFLTPFRLLFILIGFSFTAYCKSFLFLRVFRQYMPESSGTEASNSNYQGL